MDVLKYGRSLSPAQIIVYSFALFILAGTALLMLPAATVDGAGATFTDALFTIVSAVCVTGLSVTGYRDLLDLLRSGGHSFCHSGRRPGRRHGGHFPDRLFRL